MNFTSFEDLMKVAKGELVTVDKDGKDNTVWKSQHECFGTHLAENPSVESLAETATQSILRCKLWITNWETIAEGIKPELDEIRKKQLKANADKYANYTPEQIDAFCAQLQLMKEEMLKTA